MFVITFLQSTMMLFFFRIYFVILTENILIKFFFSLTNFNWKNLSYDVDKKKKTTTTTKNPQPSTL